MDYEFFVSNLLFQLKENKITIEEICNFFPKKNHQQVKNLLIDIAFPIDIHVLAELMSLFTA